MFTLEKLDPFKQELFRRALPWRKIRVLIIRWKVATAKRWLQKYDVDYKIHQRTKNLINAREEARARGIGPLDSEYPDFEV